MTEPTGDLRDGEVAYVQGSAARPYALKNIGGVYSCSCPAWRNQSRPIDQRTCKHLKKLRGEEVELDRVGEPTKGAGRKPTAKSAAADKAEGPPLLLAQRWDGELDLDGWWMSEKLDGVRAYWNGKAFLSRLGNEYHAPDWFTRGLGPEPLDGELWTGRGRFQETVSIVRRADGSDHWKRVRYVVFDMPDSDAPFEGRIKELQKRFGKGGHPHTDALEHQKCTGTDQVTARLAEVEALGGEGLMMRQPGSKYVAGRSATLLKIKSFLDAEARVIEHLPGKGRHKGRLGALRVELPDGIEFSVGTGLSDAERTNPPAVGTIITFRYQELSNDGVPRFPTFVGVRTDYAWPAGKAKSRGTKKKARAKAAPAAKSKNAARAPQGASQGSRYFELVDPKSSKFWEIQVSGDSHTVRYGRIGTAGQSKTKDFASDSAAQSNADKLIASKVSKGYEEKTPDA